MTVFLFLPNIKQHQTSVPTLHVHVDDNLVLLLAGRLLRRLLLLPLQSRRPLCLTQRRGLLCFLCLFVR